ncbi:MAG TPA: prepilin-type N-terminal cleavage/methylation domain-containing protein [Candidatus Saccharimonadales bacterium]|nr:prepilin-type N-terminal cleavage/methylation domain-containing protein [Candidatus Saccharimonadales bacterium]
MRRQGGFTLAELVLAMGVFSIATLVMSSAVLQLYKMYQSGVETRSTQQSARFIAEKISRDARSAEIIAAGSGPSANHSSVCMVSPTVDKVGVVTLTGYKYYVSAVGQNLTPVFPNNTGRIALYRGDVVINQAANNLAAIDAACSTSSAQNAQLLSGDDVSVIEFIGRDVNAAAIPGINLLEMSLSVAAKDGQTDVESVGASGGLCTEGKAEYCSITNLQFSAGPTGTKYGS